MEPDLGSRRLDLPSDGIRNADEPCMFKARNSAKSWKPACTSARVVSYDRKTAEAGLWQGLLRRVRLRLQRARTASRVSRAQRYGSYLPEAGRSRNTGELDHTEPVYDFDRLTIQADSEYRGPA